MSLLVAAQQLWMWWGNRRLLLYPCLITVALPLGLGHDNDNDIYNDYGNNKSHYGYWIHLEDSPGIMTSIHRFKETLVTIW